jgi:hypothetical protein
MAAKYPPESGEFVHPTYAIDLIWHSHMLYPLEYYEDTKGIVGYFMDHEPWPAVELCEMKASFAVSFWVCRGLICRKRQNCGKVNLE